MAKVPTVTPVIPGDPITPRDLVLGIRVLRKLPTIKDYRFDWRKYHPRTSIY